jgi:RNA polymerase sigma factor (sigma-70 family)
LLERFVGQHDEAAFAMIVRRHGGMVRQLCQSLLRNRADADDAFQATFLVLARKASTIRKQGSLHSWLYGVAYRTAVKARAARTRRRHHESQARTESPADPADELTWREAQWILHQELARLPEKYRAPLVLCYLSGKQQDEAEQLLGWREGKLRSMLERARAVLRNRLLRHGLGPGAILLATASLGGAADSVPPGALVAATAEAAAALAGGSVAGWAGVPAPVKALTEDVLQSLIAGRIKYAVCGVLLIAALGLGGASPGGQDKSARRTATQAVGARAGKPATIDPNGPSTPIQTDRAALPAHSVGVRASNSWLPNVPGQAFDSDGGTLWNSGSYAPQWIEADLRQPIELAGLGLVINQLPAGETTHELWVSDEPIGTDRTKARLVHAFTGHTDDHQQLKFDSPKNLRGRYVQMHTTQSPSWVAWVSVELRVRRAGREYMCCVDKVELQNARADAKRRIAAGGGDRHAFLGVNVLPIFPRARSTHALQHP